MATLFSQLGSSLTDASRLGTEADIHSISRRGDQQFAEQRAIDRATNFGSLARLFNIGNSLFSNLSDNRRLVDVARDKGFTTTTSTFGNIFGTPKFEKNGQEFDRSFIMSLEELDKFRAQKNLLDAIK